MANEVSDNYISVGSLTSSYGSKMVSGFSNYGKKNVDVFAPGLKCIQPPLKMNMILKAEPPWQHRL